MSNEINWPKKGNKAFAPAVSGAYFHIPSIRTYYSHHAQAFKEAGDVLLDKCQADGDSPPNDKFVFPVLYLYRHAIELNLKAIVDVGIKLEFFKKEEVEQELAWHNLAKLWNHAKKLLLHRWSTSDPAPLKATEAVINELHQSDPNGQVFRYDSDKTGVRHRYESLPDRISVVGLKKTMDGIFNFLEGTLSGLTEDLDAQREMRAEFEAEMRAQYEAKIRSQYPPY